MKSIYLTLVFFLLAPLVVNAQSQKELAQTWYSYKVGNADSDEMLDTKNHERLMLREDGSGQILVMDSNMGEIVFDFTWTFNESSNSVDVELDMNGQKVLSPLSIKKFSENEMILVEAQSNKATLYSTEISEPFKNMQAAANDNPNNTLNFDAWEGKYAFSESAYFVGDEKKETYPDAGEILLHSENGEKFITISQNDNKETHLVSQGEFNFGGNRHFVFVTEDSELAGGIMLMKDGSLFSYRDKHGNESRVEYKIAE